MSGTPETNRPQVTVEINSDGQPSVTSTSLDQSAETILEDEDTTTSTENSTTTSTADSTTTTGPTPSTTEFTIIPPSTTVVPPGAELIPPLSVSRPIPSSSTEASVPVNPVKPIDQLPKTGSPIENLVLGATGLIATGGAVVARSRANRRQNRQ